MIKGSSLSAHVLKMKAYTKQPARLIFPFGDGLVTDVILASMKNLFNQFVLIFTMNEEDMSINEIHSMLSWGKHQEIWELSVDDPHGSNLQEEKW